MNIDELVANIINIHDGLPQDARPTPEQLRLLTAVAVAVEKAEQQQRISPIQDRILKALRTLSPRPDSPPVPTVRLVTTIGGLTGRWQAWYHLNDLEERGLVHRPAGMRSGWKATDAPQPNKSNKLNG